MRISQLAERSGVPATTLRFYETAGLLPARRTTSGYRVFDQDAVERLEFIRAAKQLGLPLEEIAQLLDVWLGGQCAELKADLRPRITARLDEAELRAAELATFAASLRVALRHLDAVPDRAGRCAAECCFPAQAGSGEDELVGTVDTTERWRNAPVACSLSADDAGERGTEWRDLLAGAQQETLPEGLRVTVPIERAGAIAALVAAEQECCPFFDFRLQFAVPVLHLDVRAPQAAADLLTALFDPAAGAGSATGSDS